MERQGHRLYPDLSPDRDRHRSTAGLSCEAELAPEGMTRIGILGGSFNPAHRGHRAISLAAIRALGLDEVWWLVSPGNPLKEGAKDMAPFEARFASGRRMARGTRIRVSDFEAREGTRFTVDTVRRL